MGKDSIGKQKRRKKTRREMEQGKNNSKTRNDREVYICLMTLLTIESTQPDPK